MSKPEVPNATLQVKESLFRRYENLTVLSIFASFVVIVVVVQLISTGGSRFPTFISPVNIVNILQQVAVPGIVAISMTMVMVSGGIDLSVGMLASLVSIIVALGISMSPIYAPSSPRSCATSSPGPSGRNPAATSTWCSSPSAQTTSAFRA